MIHFLKGDLNNVILTLTEKQTLEDPNYLFRFVHRATNQEVKFVLLYAANISVHKQRYDQFSIDVDFHFANKQEGQWDYFIYEQESIDNIHPEETAGLLECGIMELKDTVSFTYTAHNPSNTFITR